MKILQYAGFRGASRYTEKNILRLICSYTDGEYNSYTDSGKSGTAVDCESCTNGKCCSTGNSK